jgi:hypothetical protein
VVDGGFCITIGSLDQSTADRDNDIDSSSVPPPPPCDAVLTSRLGRRRSIAAKVIGPAVVVVVAMAEAARSSPRPNAQASFSYCGWSQWQ